jgi:hypothetical protein
LTRRANHRHIVIIARIEPAPGNRPRAFLIGIFESDGGRIRDAASPHVSALPQDASASAAVRTCVGNETDSATPREFNMTAYLISLALAGLVAIALWEALS